MMLCCFRKWKCLKIMGIEKYLQRYCLYIYMYIYIYIYMHHQASVSFLCFLPPNTCIKSYPNILLHIISTDINICQHDMACPAQLEIHLVLDFVFTLPSASTILKKKNSLAFCLLRYPRVMCNLWLYSFCSLNIPESSLTRLTIYELMLAAIC